MYIIETYLQLGTIKKITSPSVRLFSTRQHQQNAIIACYDGTLLLCLIKNIHGSFGLVIYFNVP
jgi:hypothetical protein